LARAKAQRGPKRQPRMASWGSGIRPGIMVSHLAPLSSFGTASISPIVQGCTGCRNNRGPVPARRRGRHTSQLPAARTPRSPEIMRDQDHRHAALVAQLAQQLKHLRLHGHVERGGRSSAISSATHRRSPSRSSPAAGCRPDSPCRGSSARRATSGMRTGDSSSTTLLRAVAPVHRWPGSVA
jgi:hypothetical protein